MSTKNAKAEFVRPTMYFVWSKQHYEQANRLPTITNEKGLLSYMGRDDIVIEVVMESKKVKPKMNIVFEEVIA